MRLRYSEEPQNNHNQEPLLQQEAPLGEAAALCIITVLLVLFGLAYISLLSSGFNPFIYFQF
jgi:hypothetical protein